VVGRGSVRTGRRASAARYGRLPRATGDPRALWTVRSIYDLRRMAYGWRQCEQSYNSVATLKAGREKTLPDRFPTNHSIACSHVPKCFRSGHRTINSTSSYCDVEVGRLLSLSLGPVTPTKDGPHSQSPSPAFRYLPCQISFVPESSSYASSYSDFLGLREGGGSPFGGRIQNIGDGPLGWVFGSIYDHLRMPDWSKHGKRANTTDRLGD
jgi:hypothetical protein